MKLKNRTPRFKWLVPPRMLLRDSRILNNPRVPVQGPELVGTGGVGLPWLLLTFSYRLSSTVFKTRRRVYPVICLWLALGPIRRTGLVLWMDPGCFFSYGFRGAGNGGFWGSPNLIVERLVQLLVCVGSAFGIRVLVVGGVPAVGAVHGVLATWSRQVGEPVIM